MNSSLRSRLDLHGYQQAAIRWGKEHRQAALFLDPGLGKTAIALTVISDTLALEELPWLVVCPLRVIDQWPLERDRWAHLQHLEMEVLHGEWKSANLHLDADIYLMNYDGIPWLHDKLKASRGALAPFRNVVFDESHKLRRAETVRWKLVKSMLPMFNRRILLSGTPCGCGLEGCFTQNFTLDRGEGFGDDFNAWRERYFLPRDIRRFAWDPAPETEERIWQVMGKRALSMRAEDHLQLPELTRNEITVTLPAPIMEQYRYLEEEFLMNLEGESVLAANAAVAALKLRQVVQGGIYGEPDPFSGQKEWHQLHTKKLDALFSLIEELQGSPLLVLYQFKGELETFKAAAEKLKIRYACLNGDTTPSAAKQIIEMWNQDKVEVLMAHPQTVSLGLNLQMGSAHNVCWLAPTWSLDDHIQCEARIWRQGQRRGVVVHSIVAARTIDRRVVQALARKDATQTALLDALKEYKGERV